MSPNTPDPFSSALLRTYVLFLLIMVSLGFAGGCDKADAAVTPPPAGWGVVYEQAAVSYWGGATPALGCAGVQVELDSPLPQSVDLGYVGYASIPTQPGSQCVLTVAPLDGWGIYMRCLVYAHEYGHTLGMQHSSNPSDVMYSVIDPALVVDQQCREVVQRAHDGRWGLFSERMEVDAGK